MSNNLRERFIETYTTLSLLVREFYGGRRVSNKRRKS
jgi:hypothetical protein